MKIVIYFGVGSGKTEYRAVVTKSYDSIFAVEKATLDALGDRAWVAIAFDDKQKQTLLKLALFDAIGVIDRSGPLVEIRLGTVEFK
jgi:hypothetical protein